MSIQVAVNLNFTGKIGEDHPRKREFLNTFDNVYLEDPKSLARIIYKGHSYTAQYAHIPRQRPGKNGQPYTTTYKVAENFTGSNVLSVDLDDETPRCSIESLVADPFVFTYSSFLYSTISSRPEAPRTRIVFVAEKFIDDPEYYRLCLDGLIRQFGSDRSCKDVLKIYAGSPRCQVAFVERMLPSYVLDGMVNRIKSEEQARRQKRRSLVEQQVLSDNVTMERILDALRFLPSDKQSIDYGDWIRVIGAIHSFRPDEVGRAMAQSWSPNRNTDEIDKVFRSFDNHYGRTASVNTLFWLAKQRGWQGTVTFRNDQQRSDYVMARLFSR